MSPDIKDNRRTGVVISAAMVATGLLAGLYYAYACSVMPGLAGIDDRAFIDAMQRINTAIQNPVFFASFIGAPALTVWALVLARRSSSPEVVRLITAALVLCGVGLLVTSALNIPLNNELQRAGDPGRIADPAAVRDRFETPWVIWNVVRTGATTAALAWLGRGLLLHGRERAQAASAAASSRTRAPIAGSGMRR